MKRMKTKYSWIEYDKLGGMKKSLTLTGFSNYNEAEKSDEFRVWAEGKIIHRTNHHLF
jgi:hypothetical protein